MGVTLEPADLTSPEFVALVQAHVDFCDRTSPPESCHRLPVEALAEPGLTVWAARDSDGALVGMGALKRLSDIDGEIKSMHTAVSARGRGIARAILDAVIDKARAEGLTTLWLETGTDPLFAPARALYASAGFELCPPFGDYRLDPHSVFMTRAVVFEGAEA